VTGFGQVPLSIEPRRAVADMAEGLTLHHVAQKKHIHRPAFTVCSSWSAETY
jgi:hypothetical protein